MRLAEKKVEPFVTGFAGRLAGATVASDGALLAKAFAVANLGARESVLHDEEQDVYLVASKGFISRVTPAGKVAELKFIEGLHAPKGMAIRGPELWIADVDRLRVFDRVTGSEMGTIDLADEGALSLHDLAVGPAGQRGARRAGARRIGD